jgi:hypothetical protein
MIGQGNLSSVALVMSLSAFFLSLLVLLTPVDDYLAAATPESDDGTAAENNEFLGRATSLREEHPEQQLAPSFQHPLANSAALPWQHPALDWLSQDNSKLPSRPKTLYVFMSLQR